MNALEQMLRLPQGRARTQNEKAADAAAQEQGLSSEVDDIFTLMSIPDLETELSGIMGIASGAIIAVPGLTPADGDFPFVRLTGVSARADGSARHGLGIFLVEGEHSAAEKIGSITPAEMALYPDYDDLRRYMACQILTALGFPLPVGRNLMDPPEYVVEGCYSGFSPEGWRRLLEAGGVA